MKKKIILVLILILLVGSIFIYETNKFSSTSKDIDPENIDGIISGVGESDKGGNGFIGESGIGWSFEVIQDSKEEVRLPFIREIDRNVIEITIDNDPNSKTKNGYRWGMALCNESVGQLKYIEKDRVTGYDNKEWIDVQYKRVDEGGVNETWCGGGDAFILYSNTSKAQFPKTFIINTDQINSFTLYAGTGSATLIANSIATGLLGTAENICRDRYGILHVIYEGADGGLWYANSTDDGLNWNNLELLTGDVEIPSITCGIDKDLVVLFTNRTANTIEMVNSTNSGATWSTYSIAFNVSNNAMNEASCVVDSNNIFHCTAIGNAIVLGPGKLGYYVNSSNWDNEITLGNQNIATDDTVHTDIEVYTSNDIYIIGIGGIQDDVDIWSSKDGFTQRSSINDNLGTVNENTAGGSMAMDISKDGLIFYAGPHTADLNICNATISTWNGTWTCQEPSALESRKNDIAISYQSGIHILAGDNNVQNDSNILRTNSSNNGTSWESRTVLHTPGSYAPSIQWSIYPTSNRVYDKIRYVYSVNQSFIYYDSYDVTAPNSCVYRGGDWDVQLEDNCIVSDLVNASGNIVNLSGVGNFTIDSSGNLITKRFIYDPSGFSLFRRLGHLVYGID